MLCVNIYKKIKLKIQRNYAISKFKKKRKSLTSNYAKLFIWLNHKKKKIQKKKK